MLKIGTDYASEKQEDNHYQRDFNSLFLLATILLGLEWKATKLVGYSLCESGTKNSKSCYRWTCYQ